MSLATYGELKTAVAVWLNRADLTSYIPDFITLAEQRINYGGEGAFMSAPLRIPAMQTSETGTITASSIAFPTRFLEPINLSATSGGNAWSLDYVSPAAFAEQSTVAGLPSVYTYLSNAIKTAGTDSATYTLHYYQAFSGLMTDADTNWLLTNAPSIYLYATLIESAPFLGDDPKLSLWANMLNSSISAVNRATRYQGGGALVTKVIR